MAKEIYKEFNHIQIFNDGDKYGLFNKESGIEVPCIYNKIEWDKSSDFIMVYAGDRVGFLSNEDGSFIDFNEEDPDDSFMMAIPYELYMEEEWPEWMRKAE